jgi:hypothetical protein
MYSDNVLSNVTFRQLKTGLNKSMQAVLNATVTAGGLYLTTVSIPDTATEARIYPSQAIRVAFGETPLTISTATFVIGSIINASEWATFSFDNGLSRTLQIGSVSSVTSVLIDLQ